MSVLSGLAAVGAFLSRLLGGGRKNTVSVRGNMTGSVAQAGEGNVGVVSYKAVEVGAGRDALEELRSAIAGLQLSPEQQELVERDLGDVDTELGTPEPSRERVGKTLSGLVAKLKMANVAIDEGGKLGKAMVSVARAAADTVEGLPGL